MRLEAIPLRTRLIGTVAGGALLMLVGVFCGLGGRMPTLDRAIDTATPLPQWRPAPADQATHDYAGIDQHSLFEEDRRSHPFVIDNGTAVDNSATTFDYVLSSVLIAPNLRLAILQPTTTGSVVRVREGEAVPGAAAWTLSTLSPRSAMFEGAEGRRTLELRVYAGKGGNAADSTTSPVNPSPTSVASAPPATRAPSPTGPPPVMTRQQQLDAIRSRIEARRHQLQQSQSTPGAAVPSSNASSR